MSETFACAGLSCHNRVELPGQFCGRAECWPTEFQGLDLKGIDRHARIVDYPTEDPTPFKGTVEAFTAGITFEGPFPTTLAGPSPTVPIHPPVEGDSIQALRMQVHDASFRLNFGTEDEKRAALDTLSHLINVLQHETKT